MNKYDVVHIAVFTTLVKDSNPNPLVQNVLRMLTEYPRCDSPLVLQILLVTWDSKGKQSVARRRPCTLSPELMHMNVDVSRAWRLSPMERIRSQP